jgi:hypothetical protein
MPSSVEVDLVKLRELLEKATPLEPGSRKNYEAAIAVANGQLQRGLKGDRDEARARLARFLADAELQDALPTLARTVLDQADRIEALTRELAEAKKEAAAAAEEADQARSDADEAAIWPAWAQQMLKLLKKYGYEFDEIDGVDLPQDMADWLESYKDSAELSRDAALKRLVEIHDKAMAVCEKRHANADEHTARHAYALALHDIAALASTPTTAGQGDGES